MKDNIIHDVKDNKNDEKTMYHYGNVICISLLNKGKKTCFKNEAISVIYVLPPNMFRFCPKQHHSHRGNLGNLLEDIK